MCALIFSHNFLIKSQFSILLDLLLCLALYKVLLTQLFCISVSVLYSGVVKKEGGGGGGGGEERASVTLACFYFLDTYEPISFRLGRPIIPFWLYCYTRLNWLGDMPILFCLLFQGEKPKHAIVWQIWIIRVFAFVDYLLIFVGGVGDKYVWMCARIFFFTALKILNDYWVVCCVFEKNGSFIFH